jgi:glycosyltransferase involved in cell wall biosynthesis
MGMSVKVSIVVSTYNSGPYVEPCIASILSQSLPADEFEAIFVDDGSTDGTPDRLDRLADEHPNIRVIHIANSGGPGRPRNVGMDAAVGEYIQFVDHDDYLGDEAMERMYAFGTANGADVIVGKMAGKGRAVPRELFRVNRPDATLDNSPLIESLTPHKMFRRSFLVESGIRSPEGRRRLEDHAFVTEAYLRAGTISVLSDYICYYHLRRDDRNHFSTQPFEPVGYFTNLREALDLVVLHTQPGPSRDRLFRRWLRVEMIERLRGRRWVNWPLDERRCMFDEIRRVVVARFGPGVSAELGPIQQLVAALIVADRYDDVLKLAQWEAEITASAHLGDVRWRDGALHVTYTAELRAGSGPVLFARTAGVEHIAPPVVDRRADLTAKNDTAKADLVVRHRKTAAEYFLPVTSTWAYEGTDERLRFVLTAGAVIDPRIAASGEPLAAGVWDLFVRVSAHGWAVETKLGAVRNSEVPASIDATIFGTPTTVAQPYWTDPHADLSFDIAPITSRLAAKIGSVKPDRGSIDGRHLRVFLPVHVVTATRMIVRLTQAGVGRDLVGRLGAGGVLSADLPTDLDVDARYRIDVAFQEKFVKLGLVLVTTDPPRLMSASPKRSNRRRAARRILGALKHRFGRRVPA